MNPILSYYNRFAGAVLLLLLVGFLPARHVTYQSVQIFDDIPLIQPILEASAAFALDLSSGASLYEKNSEQAFPLASLTKIISVLTALDMVSLDEQVLISKQAIVTEGVSSLRSGEHLTVEQLLTMVMVESSNDAIMALVEYAAQKMGIESEIETWFVTRMHEKAKNLGAPNVHFFNSTGLDRSLYESGADGSGKELLTIARNSYASPIWRMNSKTELISSEGIIHRLIPTSVLDRKIPQLIGTKTGFTDLAGGNLLALVEYPLGHPIGIVVLGSSFEGRFSDVEKIFSFIKKSGNRVQ